MDRLTEAQPSKITVRPESKKPPGKLKKALMRGSLSALMLLSGSAPTHSTTEIQPVIEELAQNPTTENVLVEIRQFEESKERGPLSYEEAKEYIPLLARLVTNSYSLLRDWQDIVNHSHVVSYGCELTPEERRLFDNAVAAQDRNIEGINSCTTASLLQNYPTQDITEDLSVAVDFSRHAFVSLVGQLIDGHIVILLERANDPNFELARRGNSSDKLFQYVESEGSFKNEEFSSVTEFRSVFFHEAIHMTSEVETTLDPLLVSRLKIYLQENSAGQQYEFNKLDSEKVSGFSVPWLSYQNEDGNTTYLSVSKLNEFVTDYLATRISVKNGLPYTSLYGFKPEEFIDFKEILSQAGISDEDLFTLYRDAKLVEFLSILADGASNTSFSKDTDKLDFAISLFMGAELNWDEISNYYSGIE